jgi:hypothetical protein
MCRKDMKNITKMNKNITLKGRKIRKSHKNERVNMTAKKRKTAKKERRY